MDLSERDERCLLDFFGNSASEKAYYPCIRRDNRWAPYHAIKAL